MKRLFTTTAIAVASLLALWSGVLAWLVFAIPDQPIVQRWGCFGPSPSFEEKYWLIPVQHHPELAMIVAAVSAAVAAILFAHQRRSGD